MAAPTFAEQDPTYMLTKTGDWNESNRLADEYFAWRAFQVQRKRHLAAGCTIMPVKKFYIEQDSDDGISSISDTPDEEDSADEDSFDPLLTPTASSSLPTITKSSTDSRFSVVPMTEFTIVQIPNAKADTNSSSNKSHLRRCNTRCYSGLDKWFASNSHV
ncbi:hypothetical protein BJV82DRAFT_590402 [Fennellomyces sp. T-0311]|nr:hypothetical protein BJV82DRAFT_590402 [Fennellomyces sp. T-0311]